MFWAAHGGLILFNLVVVGCVLGGLSGFTCCLAFCRILFTTLQLLLLLLRFGAIAVAAFLLVVGFEGRLLLSMATDYSNALAGQIVVSIVRRPISVWNDVPSLGGQVASRPLPDRPPPWPSAGRADARSSKPFPLVLAFAPT